MNRSQRQPCEPKGRVNRALVTTKPKMLEEPIDFSLVLGGPLYQLFRKAHLEGDHLELLYRHLFVNSVARLVAATTPRLVRIAG